MKKKLSMLIILVMLMSLASCGYKIVRVDDEPSSSQPSVPTMANTPEEVEPDSNERHIYSPEPDYSDMPTFSYYDLMSVSDDKWADTMSDHEGEWIRITDCIFDEETSTPADLNEGIMAVLHSRNAPIYVLLYDEIPKEYFIYGGWIVEGLPAYDPTMGKYILIETEITSAYGFTVSGSEQTQTPNNVDSWSYVDLGEADKNQVRFSQSYSIGDPVMVDVIVSDIYSNYVFAYIFDDDGYHSVNAYYSDTANSGVLDLDESDSITIYGYFGGFESGSFAMTSCTFVK